MKLVVFKSTFSPLSNAKNRVLKFQLVCKILPFEVRVVNALLMGIIRLKCKTKPVH